MKYYTVEMSDNLSVIGHYPQGEYKKGYNPKENGSFNVQINEFPDFVPKLELELHKKAKPTDCLSFLGLPFGMIISEKMKETLKKHNTPKSHFYPTKIYHKNQVLNYYWFHYVIDDFWEFIDKNNSYGVVLNINSSFTLKRKIPVISKEENKKEILNHEANTIKRIGKITMKKEFPKYDFYITNFIESRKIISESLKNTIEKKGLTGMEIKLFDKFSINE
ncbi:hypothetical protein M8845_18670 [Gelidibacter japonicus]|uniref:hypothetical protein n=1 Tax=Gelidibacter japonicus TaxID=1962232 RepID=UPI0020200621|nr:hypothetical protein [Gelidibacter japonicus]MCL8009451.1 hypothetical protein [Gelidibacter japonicus]